MFLKKTVKVLKTYHGVVMIITVSLGMFLKKKQTLTMTVDMVEAKFTLIYLL